MPNMTYCRFQNTLNDLEDCLEALEENEELSEEEEEAKKRLIEVCTEIADLYNHS
jgi:hypothetical protein